MISRSGRTRRIPAAWTAAGPEAVVKRADGDHATGSSRRRALQQRAEQSLNHRHMENEDEPRHSRHERQDTTGPARPARPLPQRGRYRGRSVRRVRHDLVSRASARRSNPSPGLLRSGAPPRGGQASCCFSCPGPRTTRSNAPVRGPHSSADVRPPGRQVRPRERGPFVFRAIAWLRSRSLAEGLCPPRQNGQNRGTRSNPDHTVREGVAAGPASSTPPSAPVRVEERDADVTHGSSPGLQAHGQVG